MLKTLYALLAARKRPPDAEPSPGESPPSTFATPQMASVPTITPSYREVSKKTVATRARNARKQMARSVAAHTSASSTDGRSPKPPD